MKHKTMVLAGVALAILISAGFAFAAGSGRAGNPNLPVQGLPRCTNVQIPIFLSTPDDLGSWGLPLTISGGTIMSATPGAALAPCLTASGGFPGTSGVVNFAGCCLPAGDYPALWTLNILTSSDCQGSVDIDTAFFPPAGAYIATDCNACPYTVNWIPGSFPLENRPPVCGVNSNESVNWTGSVNKQLNASDPDACDNPLAYSLVGIAPPVTGPAEVSPSGVFTYSARCADKGPHIVTFRATDQCGASVECSFTLTVTNDAPICGANSNENVHFAAGIPGKQLNASDPNGNPITFTLVSIVPANVGPASLSPSGMFNWATVCADVGVHTVNFRVSDGCDQVDCSFQVTVFHNAPVATCPGPQEFDWNDAAECFALSGTDDGCPGPYTWSIVSAIPAPANAPTIQQGGLNNSRICFDPDCADVGKGPITIVVRLSDGDKTDDCEFTVTVTNEPPTAICPDDFLVILGDLVASDVNGTDPDDNPLTYSLISFTGLEGQGAPHNAPSLNPANGNFSWQTSSVDANDAGQWEVCVRVSDGCNLSDECCFIIDVLSYALCIRSELDSVNIHALNGQIATAYIDLSNTYPLGGIDLLVCYDPSGLTFLDAFCVDELCDWEYFTWRHSPSSNCEGGCPSGYVRIVAIADLDNGPGVHPPDASFYLDGRIVGLNFLVSSDLNFIHQCFNIGFCVLDCGDNALSSKSGDTVFIPIGSPQDCIDPTKQTARDIIDFCPGRICIDEPPDDRGDINLNFIAYEVGDAVLFTNYFIYGDDVWTPPYELSQILASDVNDDGVPLTVADLIYLIRIITGDESPFPPAPKLTPYASAGTVTTRMENNSVTVSTSSLVDIGGALLVFRYNDLSTGQPTLLHSADGLNVRSNASAGELRVLIHPSWDGELAAIGAGQNDVLSIPTTGEGTIELVEVQLSDARGALMSTNMAKAYVPTQYALLQNYPNPFNAGTVMSFDLMKDADWTLTVYNVAGQTVREFAGRNGTGRVDVAWDGRTSDGVVASSGVYFYRVNANGFNATKKMTLLK